MKKRLVRMAALMMSATMLLSVAGCGSSGTPSDPDTKKEEKEEQAEEGAADIEYVEYPLAQVYDTDMSVLKDMKIGFAQRTTSIAWETAVLNNMIETADKYGAELIYTDAGNDQTKQLSDVEDLCSQGIDALVYPAVEYESGAAALEIAADYEVPVFLLSQDCKKTEDQYVAAAYGDYVMDARLCGEWIVNNLDSAKIVEIQGQLGTDTEMRREKGFGEAIAAGGDKYEIIVQQTGNFVMDDAQQAMENIIQSKAGQFDTVFCHNDEMALGVCAALKANQLNDITVVAVDGQKAAVQKIIDGEISAIAICDTRQAEYAFSMIAAWKNGDDMIKDTSIPSEMIDSGNAKEAMTNGMAF